MSKRCAIVTGASSGWKNKLQSGIANGTPAGILAEPRRRLTEPGSAEKVNE